MWNASATLPTFRSVVRGPHRAVSSALQVFRHVPLLAEGICAWPQHWHPLASALLVAAAHPAAHPDVREGAQALLGAAARAVPSRGRELQKYMVTNLTQKVVIQHTTSAQICFFNFFEFLLCHRKLFMATDMVTV